MMNKDIAGTLKTKLLYSQGDAEFYDEEDIAGTLKANVVVVSVRQNVTDDVFSQKSGGRGRI